MANVDFRVFMIHALYDDGEKIATTVPVEDMLPLVDTNFQSNLLHLIRFRFGVRFTAFGECVLLNNLFQKVDLEGVAETHTCAILKRVDDFFNAKIWDDISSIQRVFFPQIEAHVVRDDATYHKAMEERHSEIMKRFRKTYGNSTICDEPLLKMFLEKHLQEEERCHQRRLKRSALFRVSG